MNTVPRETQIVFVDGERCLPCIKCEEVKPISEFYSRDGGWASSCKGCSRDYARGNYTRSKLRNVDEMISEINKLKKRQRFRSALGYYRRGQISETQLRTILKNIDF